MEINMELKSRECYVTAYRGGGGSFMIRLPMKIAIAMQIQDHDELHLSIVKTGNKIGWRQVKPFSTKDMVEAIESQKEEQIVDPLQGLVA